MGLVIKCVLCISGLGAIVMGGVGIHHLMNVEPHVITLENSSTKPATGKWWESYSDKNQLVSNDSKNASWWRWKYKHSFLPFKNDSEKKSSMDTHFASVVEDYSSNVGTENKALNQACWKAYEKESTDVTKDSNLQNNIKEFCSIARK